MKSLTTYWRKIYQMLLFILIQYIKRNQVYSAKTNVYIDISTWRHCVSWLNPQNTVPAYLFGQSTPQVKITTSEYRAAFRIHITYLLSGLFKSTLGEIITLRVHSAIYEIKNFWASSQQSIINQNLSFNGTMRLSPQHFKTLMACWTYVCESYSLVKV